MYRTGKHILAAAVAVAGTMVTGAAAAHPPPFYWMPDLSGHSRAGIEIMPGNLDFAGDSAFVISSSLFAELAVGRHLSLLGRLPFTYVDRAGAGDGDAAWALGNLGLGLQIATTSYLYGDSRTHYGIGLLVNAPTASDEGDGLAAAVRTAAFLVPDAGRYLPDATTVRLRGDVRYETGMLFLQGELALDHQLRDEVDDRTDLLLGGGVGIAFSHYFAVLAELTAVSDVLDSDGDASLVPVLDAGLRYHNPDMMAGLRLYWPFDEAYRAAGAIGIGVDVAARF